MAKFTTDEARAAAVRIAYLSFDVKHWLTDCSPEERQRRFDFVVNMITPTLCLYCGEDETAHDTLANGRLCRRISGGNGETYTRLRPSANLP